MATLLSLFILLLLVGGLIIGIVLWARSGSGSKNTEMSCGNCGYAVRGLTLLNCPECGVDLREAGINRAGSPGQRALGISLTLGCGAILLLGFLSTFLLFDAMSNAPVSSPSVIQSMPPMTSQSTTAAPAQPPSQPTQSTQGPTADASGSVIEHANGSKTIINPDGSSITTHPDGSTTLIQLDGTTTEFDANGEEIKTPKPTEAETP